MHFCFNGQLERGYGQQSLPKWNFTPVDVCITFFNTKKKKKLYIYIYIERKSWTIIIYDPLIEEPF